MANPTTGTGRSRFLLALLTRWQNLSRQRIRRLFNVALLPTLVLVTAMLLLFFNTVLYSSPPPWVTDVREYTLRGRLGISLTALVVLQLLMTWLLGLVAAIGGAGAASRGARLGPRLRIVRRRTGVLVAAVLGLRLVLLATLLLGAMYALTGWLGLPLNVNGVAQLERTLARRPLLPLLAGGLLLVQLFAGPFLRRRYSILLGALAATLQPKREERPWTAMSARLGAGLAGILGVTWVGAALVLALVMAADPFYNSSRIPSRSGRRMLLELFPGLPEYMQQVLTLSLVIALGLAAYLAGQIVLPWLFRALAARRLRRGVAPAVRGDAEPV